MIRSKHILDLNSHLDGLVPPTAHNLVCNEIHTVNLVFVTGQINSDLECFQIPKLMKTVTISEPAPPRTTLNLTFSVVSLLALTSIRESADHASR